MERRPRRFRSLLIGFAVLLVLVLGTAPLWLRFLGHALVHDDGPGKADIAVVLGGDYSGRRILKAAELVRDGYVPAALVSGPDSFYGLHECDYAIPFAIRQGRPAQWFIPFPHSATSTRDEAVAVLAELRRRNIHSFLLVTSDYHTARARRIFLAAERNSGDRMNMRTVAASYQYFDADSWWRTRESQKTVFLEWCKTVATALGD